MRITKVVASAWTTFKLGRKKARAGRKKRAAATRRMEAVIWRRFLRGRVVTPWHLERCLLKCRVTEAERQDTARAGASTVGL